MTPEQEKVALLNSLLASGQPTPMSLIREVRNIARRCTPEYAQKRPWRDGPPIKCNP